jgi:hypothetical protein
MSHFYGTVKGEANSTASRRGTKYGGLDTVAASLDGAIRVSLYHDEETGEDRYCVSQIPWRGEGIAEPIATGTIGKRGPG